jgi:uncharacterized protein YdhG (YjbR/CyaY superfamily)
MAEKAKDIDEYLGRLGEEQREALERVRKIICSAAPEAEECISYQLPTFRLNGRLLVAFGAWAKHCAFYPMSRATIAEHKKDLKGFDVSKGTIRFTVDKPMPATLVRKLVKARIAENKRLEKEKRKP